MDALIDAIDSDPGVKELLAPRDPIVAPTLLLKAVLGVDSFESVTQPDIDSPVARPRRSTSSGPATTMLSRRRH